MDHAMPRAEDLCNLVIEDDPVPTPTNPRRQGRRRRHRRLVAGPGLTPSSTRCRCSASSTSTCLARRSRCGRRSRERRWIRLMAVRASSRSVTNIDADSQHAAGLGASTDGLLGGVRLIAPDRGRTTWLASARPAALGSGPHFWKNYARVPSGPRLRLHRHSVTARFLETTVLTDVVAAWMVGMSFAQLHSGTP